MIFQKEVVLAPVRHTLQPLCDLSATDNFHQSQRSQQGPRSVPARLQRSRRLVGDLAATKSSPSQTYVATALRPFRDWQFPPIAEVATRSPIGPGEVAEKSATDRGPRCDQIRRKNLAATDLVADRFRQSRLPVPDQSPTSLSLKLVGDWSAIGRRLIGDLSATSLQLVGDLSATCSKIYSI